MIEPLSGDAGDPMDPGDLDGACAAFAAFLGRSDSASTAAFEALCAQHPQWEVQLREIRASYRDLDAGVPGPLADDVAFGTRATPEEESLRALLARTDRGDRYLVCGELGRGGMGVVLKVWDDELQRHVAMKTLRRRDRDEATWRRFFAEARVIGRLVHPGIVPVLEFGLRDKDQVYYTMPIVDGDELGVVFARIAAGSDSLSLDRGLEVLIKVCDAVHFAHDRGVLHRDLKPSNVMVGRYGEVFVMDWGLARVRFGADGTGGAHGAERAGPEPGDADDELSPTLDGDVLGTPSYMSPEQAEGDRDLVDVRTDVYAIGAILYHLLCGVPPFATGPHTPDSDAVLRSVRAGPPPPLLELAPSCSPELVAICERAMARSPAARYASVAELAQDLRNHLQGRVVAAYETGAFAEFRKWVRRNKAFAGAVLLAIVALAIGATLGLLQIEQGRVERERRAIIQLLAMTREFEEWSSVTPPAAGGGSPTTRWFAGARALVRGGAHSSLGLARYQELLADIERRATGSDAARMPRFDGEPLDEVLAKKRAELKWLRQMLEREPWPTEAVVQRQVEVLAPPATALGRNEVAFDLIRPDRPRRFGSECCAVVIAESAVEAATDDYERLRCLDTLAFALCRVGRWDEARQQQDRAVNCAQRYAAAGIQRDGMPLEQWQSTISGNSAMIRQLASSFLRDGSRRCDVVEQEILVGERQIRSHCLTYADTSTSLWHDQLLELVEHLRVLADRLEIAESAMDSPTALVAWQRAAVELASDPRFGGLPLTPQLGLVPLGADPESHLQEFAYVESGFAPHRDERGRLEITSDSAIVFVLVPPDGETPPFLLGKYEVTNAQWVRLLGSWPSAARDDMAVWAVRGVSWRACVERLRRAGAWLRLPTVREWQLGLHAGREPGWIEAMTDADLLATESLTYGQKEAIDAREPNRYGLYELLGGAAEHADDRVASNHGYELARAIVGGFLAAAAGPRRVVRIDDSDERLVEPETGLRCARSLVR